MLDLYVTPGPATTSPAITSPAPASPGLRGRLSAVTRPATLGGLAFALTVAGGAGYLVLRDRATASERALTAHVAVGDDEMAINGAEARLRGIATVTNVDDEPAVVHAVSASWPGVRIDMNEERAHRVPPGATAPMGVTITFTCAHGQIPVLPGRALVDTPDGGRGEVEVPITAVRSWQVMRGGACEMIQSRPAN